MKKKLLALLATTVCVSALLIGCGTTDISEVEDAEIVGELSEEAKLEMMKNDEPWLQYEKTENKNPQMESITPWDIVNDMRIGWNLGNSLESTSNNLIRVDKPFKFERAWGNPPTKEEMIDDVLAAGFNVIRVPVTWTGHMDPEYKIEESWMDRVQEVVDYAYNKGAYVIINVHHETWNYPYYDNQDKASFIERRVWAQIAERFKDYDEHLIFEAQNEPRKVGTALEWNGGDQEGWDVVNVVNEACVTAVRNSGGSNPYRMIMLPSYAASSDTKALEAWKAPEGDERIIVSVHAYTPYPFALDTSSNGVLIWNNDTAGIDALMNDIKRLFADKGYATIIGEFGAISRDDETERRIEWVHYYLSSANAINVPCVLWDNNNYGKSGERIGLYDRDNYYWVYPDYLQAMMEETASRVGEDAYIFDAQEYKAMLEEKAAEEAAAAAAAEAAAKTGTETAK